MKHIRIPEEQWLESEKWMWQEIRAGRIADFNERDGRKDNPLDSAISKSWGEDRKLRPDILKQILIRPPYNTEIPSEGVRIAGALITEEVGLEHCRIACHLRLENCRFEKPVKMKGLQIDGWFSLKSSTFASQGTSATTVDFSGAKITGQFDLENITVEGTLNMNGLEVDQSLFMNGGSKYRDVDLTGAKVGRQFALDGSNIDGKLNMNSLEVAQHLLMRDNAKFKDIDLIGAKIGGQLSLIGSIVEGKLNINRFEVGQSLHLSDNAKFKDVDIIGGNVYGQINLDGATVDGMLNIRNVVVNANVLMSNLTCNKITNMLFVHIMSNLDLSGSEFADLDISGSKIMGELCLGSENKSMTKWGKGAAFNLRNVFVDTIQDRRDINVSQKVWNDAWPTILQLDGFTYDRLGTFDGIQSHEKGSKSDRDVNDVKWYINWLARNQFYTPQPYEQLAGVFRKAGEPSKANRILYESRQRARQEAWRNRNCLRWFGSSLLNWTIGYGLGARYFRALLWVVALTAIGIFMLNISGQPSISQPSSVRNQKIVDYQNYEPNNSAQSRLAQHCLDAQIVYSLNQLIPIVQLEKYDEILLSGWVAYWFYTEKIIGWIIGSFLVAGLAGLTQKQ
jgi:hypothetical protein